MKKRLLAFLLLFTLVLTAMPLGAVSFVSSASGSEELTETDYNELYVTSNLLYSLDFYKLNEYWSPDGHDYVIPTGPSDNNSYYDTTTGKTFDFTKADNRVNYTITKTVGETTTTLDGTYLGLDDANAAIAEMPEEEGALYTAVKGDTLNAAWERAMSAWVTADGNFFKKFNNTPGSNISLKTQNSFTVDDSRLNMAHSAVDSLENGYITIPQTYYGSGLSINAQKGEVKTFEMVSVLGSNIKNNYLLMNSVYVSITKKENNTFYISGNGNSNYASLKGTVTLGNPEAPHYASYDKLTTLTYTMSGGTGSGTFEMFDGAEKVMSVEYEPGTSGIGSGNYIGYGTSLTGAKLYAVRYYSEVLTEEERAQNHFADLAKFFRLDVSDFASNRNVFGASALNTYYKAFASLDFDSAREEVQSVADTAYAALVATLSYPKLELEDYNALYVSDGLMYSLDFYKLNGYWCLDGNHGYVIPTGPSDNKSYYDAKTGKTFDFTVAENRFAYTVTKTEADGVTTSTVGTDYLGKEDAEAAIDTLQKAETGGATYSYAVTLKSDGSNMLNAAWARAVSDWVKLDEAFFKNFRNTDANSVKFITQNSGFEQYSTSNRHEYVRSMIGSIGDGYITLPDYGYASSGLILSNASAGGIKTFEMVSVLGNNVKNNYLLMNSVYTTITKTAGKTFYISGNSDADYAPFTSSVTLGNPENPHYASYDKLTTLTYTMDGGTGAGTFAMYDGAYKVMSAEYEPGSKGIGSGNYINFQNGMAGGKLYAVRYYSRVLTEAERAQNHFADIAKYFRLDVEGFIEYLPLFSTEDVLNYYKAFADFTFESSRGEVQDTADAAFAELKKNLSVSENDESYYNALYVTHDLMYSLDFFKLNKSWSPEGHDYVIPTGPSDDKAYYDATTGKTFDFTVAENRFVYTITKTVDETTTTLSGTYLGLDDANAAIADMTEEGATYTAVKGTALHAAWNRAVNAWKTADKNFFLRFTNTPDSSNSFITQDSAFGTMADRSDMARSAVASLENGYITIPETYYGSGLILSANAGDIKTFEMVSVLGSNIKNNYLLMNSVYANVTKTANNTFYISGNGNSNYAPFGTVTLGNTETPHYASYDKLSTLTYTMSGGTGAGTFTMYDGAYKVMSAEYEVGTKGIGAGNYIGYGTSLTGAKLYAVRYYSVVLTAEERAQNHFADLAKYFRIDLGSFESFSNAEKQRIYDEFASYTIENTNYVAFQKAYTDFVVGLAVEKYESHYLEGDEYAAHNAFIDACIAKVQAERGGLLSLDIIYSIPLSARADIYALSGDALTQEAISEAIAAYWSFDEEKYNSYDYLYYNDGNLVIAYDFFSLNSYWNADRVAGYLPADTSVTGWESQTGNGGSYFDRFSMKGSLAILHESDEAPFTVPTGTQRGNGGFLLFGGNNRSADGFMASGLSDSQNITLDAVLRADTVNEKLFSLAGFSFGITDGIYTSPSGIYNITASSGIGAEATLGTTAAYSLTAAHTGLGNTASLSLAVDGTEVLSATGTAMADISDTAVFGQANSFEGAVYAIRYYRTALTAEQKAQNHFADIAKFYRLDLQDIDLILCSEEAASELYAEMADCDFDGQRADIQNIYDSFRNAFLSENSTLGELRAEANEIVTFEGYQVRISGTENEAPNAYAGMRAIFIVDPDIVTDLESKGYTVKVDVITRNAQLDHTLCGKPVTIPIYNGASYVAKKQTIDGVGECYVVTVLYASGTDGNRVPLTDERVAELISFEVAYEYAITLTKDDHTYVFTSTAESERFGDTVNAKELYTYFGIEGNDEMQGLHKNDSLVKKMLLLIPEETAIEKARIGKLVLSANAEAQYKVTVPENITDTDLAAIEGFVTELDALTGAEFETVEETATRCDREIVIANGSTRADASEFATASASAGYSYAIGISGERILVYASDSLALSDALSVLLASVTDNKTDDAKNDNLDKFYLPAMLSVNNLGSSTASVSDFTVVLPASMDTAHRNLVNEYITSLASRTGITLTVVGDDKAVSGRRILVKTSADNEAAAAIFEDSSYTGYEIIAAENDILISAYSDIALRASLSALVASVSDEGIIPTDITLKCDFGVGEGVPHLNTNGTLAGGEIYEAGEDNYTVAYSGVTEQEYLAYRALLAENGFAKVAENEINENLFATYKSDGCSLILAFYPSNSDMNITIQTGETFLPTGEAAAYKKNSDITPTVTLMDHELCSYVMQLEDGSFIIVDGGDLNRRGAMDKMWDHLTSLTPEGQKPVISLWMLTHGHQDHVLLFVDFIAKYKDDMVLKAVAFNFPIYETFDMSEEIYTYQGPGIATCAPRVYDVLERYYPDVERWIPRTGQKYCVAGAEIEILFSHEDYYPNRTSNGNDTSSTWRITLGGTSIVYLGDLTDARCRWMASVYGETLESDILQVTHHGVSGGDLGLYQLIDPKICFWGTSADRFESDQCKGIGAYTSYTYNNWVRTTDWTRTVNGEEVSGVRAHYHGSVRTTLTLPLE